MNERIKQLAEQAGMVKFPPSIETEFQKNILFGDGQIEKFAELIVKECIDIAKNWEDQLENANSLSESNAVGIVAYRLARQFGVKE